MTVVSWFFSDAGQKLVQNAIAVFALAMAFRGVRNWNRERRDLRRAELAEQTLAAAYKAKDAISQVRSGISFGGEAASRTRDENETPEVAHDRDIAFVPIERLNKISAIFDELRTLRYSITAAFGVESAEPLQEFFNVRGEIVAAARAIYQEAGKKTEMTLRRLQRAEKYEAIIWEGLADEDQISQRLDHVIAELEGKFRPYVEARFKSPAWWNPFKRGASNRRDESK